MVNSAMQNLLLISMACNPQNQAHVALCILFHHMYSLVKKDTSDDVSLKQTHPVSTCACQSLPVFFGFSRSSCFLITVVSPWCDRRGWLGIKNQLSVFLLKFFCCFLFFFLFSCFFFFFFLHLLLPPQRLLFLLLLPSLLLFFSSTSSQMRNPVCVIDRL